MKEAENSISEEANIAIGRNANSRYLEKFSKKNFTIAGIRTRDFRLPVKHPINWAIETLDSSPLRFPYIFDSTFSTDSSRNERFKVYFSRRWFVASASFLSFAFALKWPATGGGPIYDDWT